MPERVYVDWEGRPAVIEGSRAWAALSPGEGWTEVNSSEVLDSGYVRTSSFLALTFRKALRGAGGFSTIPCADAVPDEG